MLIAWLKLRKRNLGPILDANGTRRRPTTQDLVHLAWVTQACRHIAARRQLTWR